MAQATINARLNATVKEPGRQGASRQRDIDDGGDPRAVVVHGPDARGS